MKKLNVAVILAGGRGVRAGFEKPKQLIRLAGRPIIEYSLTVFQQNNNIDEIIVVTNELCMDAIDSIIATGKFNKVKSIILGGEERYNSSLAAIEAYKSESKVKKINLIFHDAVRPLVSNKIINEVIEALDYYTAVDVAVPAVDTIVEINSVTGTIENIPNRSKIKCGQTPQGFNYDTIAEAYRKALMDVEFKTTDDCGVVLKYMPKNKIFIVNGSQDNIKLTYKEDIHVLDKLVQLRSISGVNLDEKKILAKLRQKVIVIFGGTSGIGYEMAAIANEYQANVIVASRSTGVDVKDFEAVKNFIYEVIKKHNYIDCVINAVGQLSRRPLLNMSHDEIMESVGVNYIGVINIAMAAYDSLKKTKGHLLNFTSSSYTYGRSYYSLYSSSKAAVVNFTQAIAEEWHVDEIKVNCINPERTNTPMRKKAFGNEPADTLLNARDVALRSLMVLVGDNTAQIVDIKK